MIATLDRRPLSSTRRPLVATVIACGAPDRGDDGAAAAAIATLDPEGLAGIRVRIVNHLRVEELLDAAELGPVVVADAAVGLPAGVVAVIPFDHLVRVARNVRVRSSHEMPVADAVGLAEMLLRRPLAGAVVALGAGTVAHGAPLSEPVRAALPRFALAIVRAAGGEARSTPASVPEPRTCRTAGDPVTAGPPRDRERPARWDR
ncbi:MAG TPA: hydrogenase maturation protease [Candidatus Limnocylindrales bacterium]|nr:hydrogenase maturation protease [Candidatus Limnocylindrales bacterium]